MKITGIIVEYNPFHNGHIHHINKAKEATNCDILIAIMSGHFTQRGEPTIVDKWTRAKYALNFGVDLVVELPFNYATQSADYFAYAAVKILNELKVDSIVFGSENNNTDELLSIATTINNNKEHYDQLVKDNMKNGLRYPDACNQAISILCNQEITLPNDLLGFSYIKEIVNNNYPITPISIQRTNEFHGTQIADKIASATSIRKGIINNTDITHTTPMHEELKNNPVFLDDFYLLLKYNLLFNKNISSYHLIEEGIENKMIKSISKCKDISSFVNELTSKRYTRSRIQRSIISILIQNQHGLYPIDYIRVLGMNKNGQRYLSIVKKQSNLPVISNYSNIKSDLLDLEMQSTKLYALASKNGNELVAKELKSIPVIIK